MKCRFLYHARSFFGCLLIGILLIAFNSCTPKAVVLNMLAPVRADNVVTLQDLYYKQAPQERGKPTLNANKIVVLGTEDVSIALSLNELKDIFWLKLDINNNSNEDIFVTPAEYVLLDGARYSLQRIAPHEAANIFISQLTDIPPFQYKPKTIYAVQANTTGYINKSGYYTANTQATVTESEDPYYAAGQSLGYALGAAITESENKKLSNMASDVYASGLVENTEIQKKTRIIGGIYWRKPRNWISPLILRIAKTEQEFQFRSIYQK